MDKLKKKDWINCNLIINTHKKTTAARPPQ